MNAPMNAMNDEWDTEEVSLGQYIPRLGIDAPMMPRLPCISRSASLNALTNVSVSNVIPVKNPVLVAVENPELVAVENPELAVRPLFLRIAA